MNSIFKRTLSLFLALMMCISLLPVSALAEESEENTESAIEIIDTISLDASAEEQNLREALDSDSDYYNMSSDITLSADMTISKPFNLISEDDDKYKLIVPNGVTLKIEQDCNFELCHGAGLEIQNGGALVCDGWLSAQEYATLNNSGTYSIGEQGGICIHAASDNTLPDVSGVEVSQIQIHKNCASADDFSLIFDMESGPFKDYSGVRGKIRGKAFTLDSALTIPDNCCISIEDEDGTAGSLTLGGNADVTVEGSIEVWDSCTLADTAGSKLTINNYISLDSGMTVNGTVDIYGHFDAHGGSVVNNGTIELKTDWSELNLNNGTSYTNNGALIVCENGRINVNDGQFTNAEVGVVNNSGAISLTEVASEAVNNGTWNGNPAECYIERTVGSPAEFLEAVFELNGKTAGGRRICLSNSITVAETDITAFVDALSDETRSESGWADSKIRFIGQYYICSIDNNPEISLTIRPDIITGGRDRFSDLSFGLNANIEGKGEFHTHVYVGAENDGETRTLTFNGDRKTCTFYNYLDISDRGKMIINGGSLVEIDGEGIGVNNDMSINENGRLHLKNGANFNYNNGTLTNAGEIEIYNAQAHIAGKAVNTGTIKLLEDGSQLNINESAEFTNASTGILEVQAGYLGVNGSAKLVNNGKVNINESDNANVNVNDNGSIENNGTWTGKSWNVNLVRNVETAEEFIDAVCEFNGQDANCRTIILNNDITIGNDELKEDWEGKLLFIGDYQIRSVEDENFTLTLNCDVVTDCTGEGDNAAGSLGILTDTVLNGQMDCYSYLFVAPDWEDINAKLTVSSGSTLTVWGDAKVNSRGILDIKSNAKLIVKRYLGVCGNGQLVNNGEVVVTYESDDNYANICLESNEAYYSGSGVWNGYPLRYNQYYEVSNADELIQAVNTMNDSECPGNRTIALKNDIDVPADDSGELVLKGDYKFCSADENEYTLTLNREARLDCIQVGDNPNDMNGSLSVNLNLVVNKDMTVNAISQIGGDYDGARNGSVTVKAGADFKSYGRCTVYENGKLTVNKGASVSFNEWDELRGEMDIAGSLNFLNETSGMDALNGSELNITGTITSANTDCPVFACESSTVSVPESEENFVIYQRCFKNVANLVSFIENQDGKNYEAQFEGTGVLESSLTIPENIQLLLYGYDEDEKTTFTVKSGATLTVGRLLVFAEMVVEDGAAVCIKDGCELQNRSDGCLITNNGTVNFEENSWFKLYGTLNNNGTVTMDENSWFGFYGHCINNGSFTNSGYTEFCGWLEGEGEWNMDGGASISNYVSTEQEFIDAVNRLSECDCNERRLYLDDNITLTQVVTVKGNFRICSDNGYGLTVAENGKIKVENFGDTCGQLYVEVPLTVEGTLDWSEGSFEYNRYDGGELVFGDKCVYVPNTAYLEEQVADAFENGGDIISDYPVELTLSDDYTVNGWCYISTESTKAGNSVLIVPNGKTLMISEGNRLILDGGTVLKVEAGGKLINNGKIIINSGSLEICDGGIYEYAPNSTGLSLNAADNGGSITGISDDVAKEQIEYWRDCADSNDIDEFFAVNKPCKGKTVAIVGAVTLTKDLVIENDDAIVISADNAEGTEETQLIIPDGVTVTVKSWLEQNEATSILIKNGGSLILEDGSYLYQAGPIYVEEGGTLTRGGDEELVSYASTREDLESIISDYRDIVTEDPDANLSIVLDNDIAVEDLDLTGVPLTIDDNWIESQNRNARLTVNGKMTVDSRLTLRIESEFTAGSTLDNEGIIVVLAPMDVNGEYKGHLDGYQRGRLVQPWGPGLAEDIYITGEDILKNITLNGVLGGDDPQSALKSAIAESAPSITGAMELVLSLDEGTDRLTITEKISLPENVLLVIEDGKTLEVSSGGELSVDGGVFEADSGSVIINSGAITVNSGELYVDDGVSLQGSLIAVKDAEYVEYAGEEIYFIGMYGDVDGNGEINVLDVGLLRRAAAGLETLTDDQKAAANVYYDGRNNSLDVNLLRRYIANIVSQIPYTA